MKDAIVTFARRTARDIKHAVVIGLAMGGFFCVIALAILLFRGRGPFDRNQVSVLRVLLTYLSAFALGGLILGLTMPLTKWLPGAALVAFLVAFGVWFCVGWSVSPLHPLISIAHTSAVLGAAFGLPIGVGFWIQGRIYDRTGRWY